ncbi:MAG: sensor histidine kinase [Eubacteriales bacterium]|nr:sensor histidine kinase [Eubacteriales bacterium]
MKNKYKKTGIGIYRKVIICFSIILVVVTFMGGIIVNNFCVRFIKEQRISYNTQMLEKMEYEFKELYVQMNQLLSSLYDSNYEFQIDETTFQKIKRELEFEESVQNIIYLNGFQNFCKAVLFYDNDEQFYYAGDGPILEGYVFSEDERFQEIAAGFFQCTVIGPMPEQYRPERMEKENVIGFVKRKSGKQTEGSLPPFVMVTVKFEKVEEMMESLLSANTGFFLMNGQGEILSSNNFTELSWDETMLKEAQETILSNQEQTQTISKAGILLTSIRLSDYGWTLSVADSEKVLFQDITELTWLVAVLICACSLAGILMAMVFSKKILFPIEELKKMVNEIAKDDKSYLEEASSDEMGEVQALLNGMKKKIQELIARQYILEVREAEIRTLQSQINPHFLHNTLDNIYCIAQIEEIEPIVKLTKLLSEMMRYSVNNKNVYASLEDEMNHVRSYVEILNIRYEDRIHLQMDIPPRLQKAQVVKLLLQPIVENACIHGILPKQDEGGFVLIKAEQKGEDLEIQVEDDGVGIAGEVLEQLNNMMKQKARSIRTPQNKGFGIALVNVNDRISLLDGEGYGLRLEERDGGGIRVTVLQRFRPEK